MGSENQRKSEEPRSDKKKASNWEKERSRKQVHIYQPAYIDISSSGTINEINGINNSTLKENEGELSVRRSPRYKRRVSYVEVEDSDEDSDEEKKSRKLKRVNSHLQSTESPQQSTESLQSVPSTPPQAPRDLSPLMTTPNKRPLERKI
ncbi:hypothetical protein C1646_674813 [Rhizophagus diaphanus]|nr:hypothetical protein C1646_674813 [Rhizophagus diaphanus] [Rhizophagus sp. MUCL 43196]